MSSDNEDKNKIDSNVIKKIKMRCLYEAIEYANSVSALLMLRNCNSLSSSIKQLPSGIIDKIGMEVKSNHFQIVQITEELMKLIGELYNSERNSNKYLISYVFKLASLEELECVLSALKFCMSLRCNEFERESDSPKFINRYLLRLAFKEHMEVLGKKFSKKPNRSQVDEQTHSHDDLTLSPVTFGKLLQAQPQFSASLASVFEKIVFDDSSLDEFIKTFSERASLFEPKKEEQAAASPRLKG